MKKNKSTLNQIRLFINTFFDEYYKKTIEVFLVLFLIVAFRQYYISFFDNFIVIPILSKFQDNIFYKISSLVFFALSIVFIIRQIISMSIFNFKTIDWALIGVIFNYVNLRNYYCHDLIFKPIAYSDLPFILLTGYYLLGCVKIISIGLKNIFNKKNKNKELNISFESDQPEKDPDDDLSILGYRDHAKRIAQKINSYDNKKSLSIGIAAKWGSGKSTLMHFIEKELMQNNNKYHIVWLQSWDYKSTDKLLNDFFKSLDKKISKELFGLTSFFSDYKSKLIQIESRFLKTSLFEYLYNDPIKDDYLRLNKKLSKINKKVVVFIDDLDRLEKNEIIEILKLIRQTGSFDNFIYISSYDKAYIANALLEINKYNHHVYIEKIFQVEFTLPTIDTKKYVELFEEYFLSKIPLNKRQNYIESLNSTDKFLYNLDFSISTTRDAKRLANQIFFDTSNDLWDYINIFEFIQIAAIKYRYPELYDEIQYEFHKLNVKNSSDINNLTSKLKHLEQIGSPDKERLTNILGKLFKGKGQEVKSISNIYHFDRYFSFKLTNEENFTNEVRNIFNSNENTLQLSLNQNKLDYNTIQVLINILKEYETKTQAEYYKFFSTYFILGAHIEYNSIDIDLINTFRIKLYNYAEGHSIEEIQNIFDFFTKYDSIPYSFTINMIQYLFEYNIRHHKSDPVFKLIFKQTFVKILNSVLNYTDQIYWKEGVELIRLIRNNIELESNSEKELEDNSKWFKDVTRPKIG